MKFALLFCLVLNFSTQAFASQFDSRNQALTQAEVEELLGEAKLHFNKLGYRISAVGRMSTKLHPQMYHMTFRDNNDSCVQTITLEKEDDQLMINYMGEIDCR